jgi:hypothetical protein
MKTLVIVVYSIFLNLIICEDDQVTLLSKFFDNYTKAKKDDMNYYAKGFKSLGFITLAQVFEDPEAIAQFYYSNVKLGGYIISFPNQSFFIISIYVKYIL